MSDAFANRTRSPSDPAVSVFAITPDDSADLPMVTTALSVRAPGLVQVTTQDGSTGAVMVHPGRPFPIRATKVWLSGTTATGITGLV